MDPGTMERLQSHGYFEEEANEHVGLWNVMRRCKLYFKTDVELQLSPAPGGGVVVALRLLAQFEDE
jgi:two-component system sensor histidine kinase YesM